MNKHGFSYIEILVALAIFSIALVAVLPVLAHSGRNQATAYTHYAAHLQAQHLMHHVRHALTVDDQTGAATLSDALLQQVRGAVTIAELAFSATHGDFAFVVYLVRVGATTRIYNPDTPNRTFTVPGFTAFDFDFSAFPGRTGIVVLIFNEHSQIIGRALGVA
ncbi:MAG: type II secretion system GspH family protein [Defluviitaleaceae bacterium]|nr:type II secretion system GspH family protein [Defluviitaleaceae bacterium]